MNMITFFTEQSSIYLRWSKWIHKISLLVYTRVEYTFTSSVYTWVEYTFTLLSSSSDKGMDSEDDLDVY